MSVVRPDEPVEDFIEEVMAYGSLPAAKLLAGLGAVGSFSTPATVFSALECGAHQGSITMWWDEALEMGIAEWRRVRECCAGLSSGERKVFDRADTGNGRAAADALQAVLRDRGLDRGSRQLRLVLTACWLQARRMDCFISERRARVKDGNRHLEGWSTSR